MSKRPLILLTVSIGIVLAIWYLQTLKTKHTGSIIPVSIAPPASAPLSNGVVNKSQPNFLNKAVKNMRFPLAREIVNPSGFINTPPITIQSLIGKKVILVDFWTYSCINCIRTLPYLRAWYDKYKNDGLEILSIHTPEFDFEKKLDNVQAAVTKFGITYPVVLDNDYGTWTNYNNRYWPHKYLIDIDGYIIYDHVGEGGYEATERKIQELLAEKMAREGESGAPTTTVVQVPNAQTPEAQSPETYFGAARNSYLANGRASVAGNQTLTEPAALSLNELNLVGSWHFVNEFATNLSAQAKIIYRYQAKNVYLVGSADHSVRIRVLRDGKPLTKDFAGADVTLDQGQSYATIKTDRLYELIHDTGVAEHVLQIIIEEPGLKAYTFTFG